jgi:hypothetical protein
MRAAIAAIALLAAVPARADRPAPPPPAPMTPITARVIEWVIQGKAVVITLDRGGEAGVTTGVHGHLVDDHGRAIPHGDFTILRVDRRTSVAKVAAPVDVIAHRPRAVIEPR